MAKKSGKMSSKASESNRTIIWAIDPYRADEAVLKSAAWTLRAILKGQPARVQPVYVWTWTRTLPGNPMFSNGEDLLAGVQRDGQDAIDRVLSRVDVPGVEPLRVISTSIAWVRDETRELVEYAKKIGAEMIVVPSRGLKGIKRWAMGSFAETLCLASEIPLLVVHPNVKRTPDLKSILFPTDFSEESLHAFDRILEFAAARGSHITLFHKNEESLVFPVLDVAFTAQAYYERARQTEFAVHRALAQELVHRGKARGVRVIPVFDRSAKTTASEAILAYSKRYGSLIAMASRSGPVSATMLGSLSRKVVRYSEQPFWILHPTLRPAAKSSAKTPVKTQVKPDSGSQGKRSGAHALRNDGSIARTAPRG